MQGGSLYESNELDGSHGNSYLNYIFILHSLLQEKLEK